MQYSEFEQALADDNLPPVPVPQGAPQDAPRPTVRSTAPTGISEFEEAAGMGAPVRPAQRSRASSAAMSTPPTTRPPTPRQTARTPVPVERNYTRTEALGEAMRNAPGSFLNLAKSMGAALVNPGETLQGVAALGKGAVSKAKGALGFETDKEDERVLNSVLDQYRQTYFTSEQDFLRALAKDPATILADLSAFVTGGATAVAKTAGQASRLGTAATKVAQAAQFADPVQLAVKSARTVGKGVAGVTRTAQSVATGVPRESLRIATQIGSEGTPDQKRVFRAMQQSSGDHSQVVGMAEEALDKAKDARRQQYQASMANRPAVDVSLTDPGRRLNNYRTDPNEGIYRTMSTGRSVVLDPDAARVLDEIENLITPFAMEPAGSPARSVVAADQLKQAIGRIQRANIQNPNAYRVATDMYKQVRDSIARADPDYMRVMGEYEKMSDFLTEVRQTFGVGRKISDETILRRLTKADSGPAKQLLQELHQYNPNLTAAIAGAATSEWAPHGLRANLLATLPIMSGAMTANPLVTVGHALGQFAVASPRLSGNVAYGMGQAAKPLRKATQPGVTMPLYAGSVAREELLAGTPLTEEEAAAEEKNKDENDFLEPVPGIGGQESAGGENSLPAVGEAFRPGIAPRTPGLELDFSQNRPTRNRNPGNLEATKWTQSQPGYIGSDGRFAVFDTPESGHAAAQRLLANKLERDDLNTPRKLIMTPGSGWDPVAGPQYMEEVAREVGIGVDDPFPVDDPQLAEKVYSAIRRIEGGLMNAGGRVGRKSGGRVHSVESIVNELMAATKAVRRETDKHTEVLLNHPDEAVVKALDVAQQAI